MSEPNLDWGFEAGTGDVNAGPSRDVCACGFDVVDLGNLMMRRFDLRDFGLAVSSVLSGVSAQAIEEAKSVAMSNRG